MENTLSLFCPGRGTLNSEDAIPIVEENFLLVADGLGGSGGFAHGSIEEKAMSGDTFLETIFKDIFADTLSDDNKEKLNNYIAKSFEKYFALSTEEKRDRRCIYRSGYFASRIVATLMYGYLLKMGKENIDGIFKKITSGEQCEKDVVADLGKFFTTRIYEGLRKAAENGNFVYESRVRGLTLLPTTLVTVLYDEHEEYVDAIYLWAGDSRGYIWDAKGLIQVTEDHEIDGIMTNQVNLSNKFHISCKYVRIQKPCMLLCTSDGCYSCMTSPLDFEYYFFDQMKNAGSFEEAEALLRTLYVANSEDDTNTVSMKVFGYDSYDSLKSDISKRVQELKDVYEKELSGIFAVNYDMNRSNAKKQILKVAKDINICDEKEIEELIYSKLSVATEMEEKKASIKEKRVEYAERLKAIIKANYWFIAEALRKRGICADYYDMRELKRNILSLISLDESKKKYIQSIERLEREFDTRSAVLKVIFSKLKEYNTEILYADESTACYNFLYNTADILYDIYGGRNRDLRECIKVKERLDKSAEKYTEKNMHYVVRILNGLLNSDLDVEFFNGLDCFDEIREILSAVNDLNSDLAEDKMAEVLHTKAQEYWKKNCVQIMYEFYTKKPESPFWSKCNPALVSALVEYTENEKCISKREDLYSKYNQYYYSV